MLLELYSDQKDDATTQENVVIPPPTAPGKSATEKEFASLSDLDPLSKIHINAEIEVAAAAVEANEMSLECKNGNDQLEDDFDMKFVVKEVVVDNFPVMPSNCLDDRLSPDKSSNTMRKGTTVIPSYSNVKEFTESQTLEDLRQSFDYDISTTIHSYFYNDKIFLGSEQVSQEIQDLQIHSTLEEDSVYLCKQRNFSEHKVSNPHCGADKEQLNATKKIPPESDTSEQVQISNSILDKVTSIPAVQVLKNADDFEGLEAFEEGEGDSGYSSPDEVVPHPHPCWLCKKEFASQPDLKSHLRNKHDDCHNSDDRKLSTRGGTNDASLENVNGNPLSIDELACQWVTLIKKGKPVKLLSFYIVLKKKLKPYNLKGKPAFVKSVLDRILSMDDNISIERSDANPNDDAFNYTGDINNEFGEHFKKVKAVLRKSLSCLSTNFNQSCGSVLNSIQQCHWDANILIKVGKILVKKAQKQSRSDSFFSADLCREVVTQGDAIHHEDNTPTTKSRKAVDYNTNSSVVQTMTKGDLFRKLLIDFLVLKLKCKNFLPLSVKAKKVNYIGLMQFLTAIYSKGVDDGRLPDIINEYCLKVFIHATDDEDLLDCLNHVLLTVGCKLEQHFQHKQQQQHCDEIMPSYFTALEKVSESHLSDQIRNRISRLLRLRASGWATSSTVESSAVTNCIPAVANTKKVRGKKKKSADK